MIIPTESYHKNNRVMILFSLATVYITACCGGLLLWVCHCVLLQRSLQLSVLLCFLACCIIFSSNTWTTEIQEFFSSTDAKIQTDM